MAGTCKGCTPDGDEPNETMQTSTPPMASTMRPFDTTSNTFKITSDRTTSNNYTMSSPTDVDVHYLVIQDNAPTLPYAAGFEIMLSNVPPGATYELDLAYYCTVAPNQLIDVYSDSSAPTPACDPTNTTNTGNLGDWFYCNNTASTGTFSEFVGFKCNADAGNTDDSGILQIAVKMKTPPTTATCAPYTLSINAFAINQ
jgi:hypothetical protein